MKLDKNQRKKFRVTNKVKRVASKDSPVPYNWFLEENVLIQTKDIVGAINNLLEY